jgi:hypothetical protein
MKAIAGLPLRDTVENGINNRANTSAQPRRRRLVRRDPAGRPAEGRDLVPTACHRDVDVDAYAPTPLANRVKSNVVLVCELRNGVQCVIALELQRIERDPLGPSVR